MKLLVDELLCMCHIYSMDTNRVIVHSTTNVQLTHANTIPFFIFNFSSPKIHSSITMKNVLKCRVAVWKKFTQVTL